MLDLNKLMHPRAERIEETRVFDFSQADFAGYTVPQPVTLRYSATPQSGTVWLELWLDAEVEAPCSRCMGPACQPVHIETAYRVRQEELREEFPQLPIVRGGLLDLQELAYGELVIEAPGAILCREDCEGLCQHCGAPAASCGCATEEAGDPRWQVLKDLLAKEDD